MWRPAVAQVSAKVSLRPIRASVCLISVDFSYKLATVSTPH
jgi:hypothetical protein